MLSKMGVMRIRHKHCTSSDSAPDSDGGGLRVIDQERKIAQASTDVRRVIKSREIINRRIVRVFKSMMGSSEQIEYAIDEK